MGFPGAEEPDAPLTHEERYRQFVSDFWVKIDRNQASPFEVWHREYTATHGSASYRATERFNQVRDEVQAEDARQAAQNAPERTEAPSPKNFTVDDEIEAREAKFEASVDEYNDGTTAAPDGPAPDDAPEPSEP